ncbi:uncharacterized protein MELLADRAFT_110188 [Melampsora larici-populina 98AG31]|uniref:Uncharacterized protein n=1 Tax=Melampsora larici-populina (strain 98AG31 / pathotype 3-4-7) TaxID=747676 RepID=F4RYY8_MELLP|nr:uncharacterized protein MELLADRAFT_110188 [Melampsora larici-populina 98AG31]EGG02419.1 hypothetical protein MELLADRAFT_110188 [Melampsora larici-populina 98AG31]
MLHDSSDCDYKTHINKLPMSSQGPSSGRRVLRGQRRNITNTVAHQNENDSSTKAVKRKKTSDPETEPVQSLREIPLRGSDFQSNPRQPVKGFSIFLASMSPKRDHAFPASRFDLGGSQQSTYLPMIQCKPLSSLQPINSTMNNSTLPAD